MYKYSSPGKGLVANRVYFLGMFDNLNEVKQSFDRLHCLLVTRGDSVLYYSM